MSVASPDSRANWIVYQSRTMELVLENEAMSSVTRKFRVVEGKVKEVTETPRPGAGSSTLPPLFGGYGSAYSDTRPGSSMSMSCHSREIDLMNQKIKEHGIVGVHYERQYGRRGQLVGGKCVITNNSTRTGRRKWMEHYGKA